MNYSIHAPIKSLAYSVMKAINSIAEIAFGLLRFMSLSVVSAAQSIGRQQQVHRPIHSPPAPPLPAACSGEQFRIAKGPNTMTIIAIASTKGGVGKTTISANLGMALVRAGRPVVLIDLDPQDALRLHFSAAQPDAQGLARAACDGTDWRASLVTTASGCDLLPYGRVNEFGRESFEQLLRVQPQLLRDGIAGLRLPADAVVILDTPPGPSVYLGQALSSCNTAVVALLSDAASYATLPMMHGLLQRYCFGRTDFRDHAYLINQVDSARQLNADVAHVMRMQFGARALPPVHHDQAIPEALACNQFVGDYDPLCRATQDLAAMAQQLAGRLHLETSRAG